MGHHTFYPEMADRLEDSVRRYRYLSMEEVVSGVGTSEGDVVADLGSGTGFYADDVAPRVEKLYAVDIQEEMHDRYREKGVPDNVELVTAGIDDLPFDDDSLDAAYSTMTYHEFATSESLAEVNRVLRSDSRLYVADWSSQGTGVRGPPTDERYSAEEAAGALREAGFEVERVEERTETFVVVARN
jgi:ubiquinone/menaquinone biosynthesis C-methylase UbiE